MPKVGRIEPEPAFERPAAMSNSKLLYAATLAVSLLGTLALADAAPIAGASAVAPAATLQEAAAGTSKGAAACGAWRASTAAAAGVRG